jgi:hypothetical protein
MINFSKAFSLMKKGIKVRQKFWSEDYYIYIEGDHVYDSLGNLYISDVDEFYKKNKIHQCIL